MHVNVLVWLKPYVIEFLKVELTHPDNAIGGQTTPACIRLHWTQTGLNYLCVIDSPHGAFDPGLDRINL